MYIVSFERPSPGIDPRMPIVWAWSLGLHTSTVAHSSRECSSEWAAAGAIAAASSTGAIDLNGSML